MSPHQSSEEIHSLRVRSWRSKGKWSISEPLRWLPLNGIGGKEGRVREQQKVKV